MKKHPQKNKHKRKVKAIKFEWKLIFLSLTVFVVFVYTSFDTLTAITNQQSVSQSLQSVNAATSGPSVYYGNYVPNGFQIGANLATIEADGGKGLAIIPWYLNWSSGFPNNTMDAIRGHGSIPELTWQPDGITLPQIINGTYDSYLTKWAQDAKTWGHPFFLRFAHEMNGGYSWSEHAPGNSVGQYVTMWQHVHNIFTSAGATNITWVWCPNIDSPTSVLQGLYPGDNYVDWTCMDGYNWGTSQPQWHSQWRLFSNLITGTYKSLLTIAPSKPIMIGETASVEQGGDKAAWITDALSVQLPLNFPAIKAFVWFNEANTDWKIETSATAQQAFAQAIGSPYYAGNIFSNINQSPIPPLNGNIPTSVPTSPPANSPAPTSVAIPTQSPVKTPSTTPVPTVIPPINAKSIIAYDTFIRKNQKYWGTASDGHVWGGNANSPTQYQNAFSIDGNTGREAARGGSTYTAILGNAATDALVYFTGRVSGFKNSNFGAVLRYTDDNNWYKAYIDGTNFIIQKRTSTVNDSVKLVAAPFQANPGTNYSIRFEAIGTQLNAKIWKTGTPEPGNWTLTTNDSDLTSGYCGLRILTQNGTVANFTSFIAVGL